MFRRAILQFYPMHLSYELKHLSVCGNCESAMVAPMGCSVDVFARAVFSRRISNTWPQQSLRQVQSARVLMRAYYSSSKEMICNVERFLKAGSHISTLQLFAKSDIARKYTGQGIIFTDWKSA